MVGLSIDPGQSPAVALADQLPVPELAAGELLLKVRCAGICSTDLEIAAGYMGYRGVPGHEFVGDVVAGVDDDDELLGARVVAEINCVCHECDLCRRGLPTHCRRRTVIGILGRGGAFAEYLAVPRENCLRVPESIPDQIAVFTEPLAAAIQIVRQVPVDASMKVSVIGSGRMGLLIGQVLAAQGSQLNLIGRNPLTLSLAKTLGLQTTHVADLQPGMDQDLVVDATGAPAGLILAQQLVRPRGSIVLKSTYTQPEPIDLSPLVINEVKLIGNRCGPFADALEWLEHGRVQVEPLITARVPLRDAAQAFEAARQKDQIKVLIEMGVA
jgi:2-desacetyl-2-hydroxyethyl bacteriochlorophyllide A dehydrogenase